MLSLYMMLGVLFGIFLFLWDEDCVAVKHLIGTIVASVFIWPILLMFVIVESTQRFGDWVWNYFENNRVLNKRLKVKKDD